MSSRTSIEYPFSKRPDYTQAIALKKSNNDRRPTYEEIKSFRDVIDHVRGSPALLEHFGPPIKGSIDRELTVLGVGLFITGILNRSIYLYGLGNATDEAGLRSIYLEMETPVFSTQLPVDFLVPVVLTRFELHQAAELCPGMRIERLSDGEHVARLISDMTGSPVNQFVIGAASHSLVLTQRTAAFKGRWDFAYRSLDFYPLEDIQRFFEALRLATGYDTGYGQLLIRPLGWALDYHADLPPIMLGPTVREYPDRFDDGGWREETPVVSLQEIQSVGTAITGLASGGRTIALAARRLSSSKLRAREDDRIIDLCIALEALLGDDRPGETTHKLALRVAAIYSRMEDAPLAADTVFETVKRIYAYRSLVVHGSDPAKRRLVTVTTRTGGSAQMLATALAEHYLRVCLSMLLGDTSLQDPGHIDRKIVLGSLDRPSGDPTEVEEPEPN